MTDIVKQLLIDTKELLSSERFYGISWCKGALARDEFGHRLSPEIKDGKLVWIKLGAKRQDDQEVIPRSFDLRGALTEMNHGIYDSVFYQAVDYLKLATKHELIWFNDLGATDKEAIMKALEEAIEMADHMLVALP